MSSTENMHSIQIMYFMLNDSYTGMVELLWKFTNVLTCFCAGIHTLVSLFFINSVILFLSFIFFFLFEFITVYVDY